MRSMIGKFSKRTVVFFSTLNYGFGVAAKGRKGAGDFRLLENDGGSPTFIMDLEPA